MMNPYCIFQIFFFFSIFKQMRNKSLFQQNFPFERRYNESHFILKKYPDRVPVICEKGFYCNKQCPTIDKIKFLVPYDLTVSQFLYVIRRRLRVSPEMVIFLCHGNHFMKNNQTFYELYSEHKNADGYFYCFYLTENVFG